MVLQSFAPVLGGAQLQVEHLAPLLRDRGVAVDVLTRRVPGTDLRERRGAADVRRVRCAPGRAGASVTFTAGAALAMRALRPDVVHAHDLLSPSLAALAGGALVDSPVVAKVLSSGERGDVARLRSKPLGDRRLQLISRRVAAFVCPSRDTADDLLQQGIPPERIELVPNGVDAQHFRPADDGCRHALREELGLPPDATIALYCGRLTAAKRIDVLLEAFRGGDVHLVLAGDGDAVPDVLHAARSPGLAGIVHHAGLLDDPAPLYRGADVLVSASEQDGMSNTVLEAMASALPVVATRAGGMAELLGPGGGVLVAPGDAKALGAAVRQLAADPERRRRLGTVARRRAARHFSLGTTADRLSALYDRVLLEARP